MAPFNENIFDGSRGRIRLQVMPQLKHITNEQVMVFRNPSDAYSSYWILTEGILSRSPEVSFQGIPMEFDHVRQHILEKEAERLLRPGVCFFG